MKLVLKNFRIVDETLDTQGALVIEDGIIQKIISSEPDGIFGAAMVIDGSHLARGGRPLLMPAFVDLHAHFRDTGMPPEETAVKETAAKEAASFSGTSVPAEVLEAASLAAAAGGFGTVVCMANTRPVIDTPELAAAIKRRADALGLIDLYPVLSLTRGMEGKELSDIKKLLPPPAGAGAGPAAAGVYMPLMLSEDGKDLASESLFLAAMKEARRLGIPVSCHCDFGGADSEAAKKAGEGRRVWSRIEENNATGRAVELGREARCHIHIAHVSTKEAVQIIRRAKAERASGGAEGGFTLSCEAMPHNIALTEETARALGDESCGRVNPPLRAEEDREALVRGILDGTIDAIATDHAPHTQAAKARGTPGFSSLETAFSVCYTCLVRGGLLESSAGAESRIFPLDLRRLSSLMSANPARILGLGEAGRGAAAARGRIAPGFLGDLVVVDPEVPWKVEPELLKTRGKNSPFAGKELWGKILMTFRKGRLTYFSN